MKNLMKASFLQRIVLPAVLAILLFVSAVFLFIIPAYESIAIGQKRQMLNELTNTAWSILNNYYIEAKSGKISQDEAKSLAIAEVEALRYGKDKKDYFWIIDEEPTMVMHPYVHELTGESLHDYSDPDGKKPFIEASLIAKAKGEGYINYKWQFKDDKSRIVPKLSFVKYFPVWGWIIGTGIYLDDVQTEISELTHQLILILLGITLFIALIIVFIAYQSLRIENQRYSAEQQLHESREKYKSLLESSTEGILLWLDGKITYANTFVLNWLEYQSEEIEQLHVNQLVKNIQQSDFDNISSETSQEVVFIRKDGSEAEGILTIQPVRFAAKQGLLFTLRDTKEQRAVKSELEQYRQFLEHSGLFGRTGFFSFPMNGRRFHTINQYMADLLGYDSVEELKAKPIFQVLQNKTELRKLINELKKSGIIQHQKVQLTKHNGEPLEVIVNLSLTGDNYSNSQQCFGTIDLPDINSSKEELITLAKKLNLSELNDNRKLIDLCKPICSCNADASIQQALEVMRQEKSSYILIRQNTDFLGIITASDIVSRMFKSSIALSTAAVKIMSAPIINIDWQATTRQAINTMLQHNIKHLLVSDNDGNARGMLASEMLLKSASLTESGLYMAIDTIEEISELHSIRSIVPEMINAMGDQSYNAQNSSKIISEVNDAITKKIIDTSINELGMPPVAFCFMVIGSAGRNELVFSSDQDNAIIYEDNTEFSEADIRTYFLQLGEKISDRLQKSGLPYCPGNYMASNPKWCQPLSIWKRYFTEWIETPEPENILNVSVFFDLRYSYGNQSLFDELDEHVFASLNGKTTFFYLLAQSVAAFKPPLNVFGGILSSNTGTNEILDLKSCISQIVMFARIYALRKNVRLTNTIQRIEELHHKGILSTSTTEELLFQFKFLTQKRIEKQLKEKTQGVPLTNNINPKKLSEIEQMILKKLLSQMGNYHEKISAEFMSAFKG